MRSFFRQPFDDVMACLEPIVTVKSPIRAMGLMMATLIVAWFIYVPIHELLHVLGCVLAGGEVQQLEIARRYGGALVARVFPFVVSGGEYAGRLSGFDWKGSDLIYLATDFMPYLLTVLIGVPLIRLATRRRRPVVFGLGIVLGLAPFYNLPGDYYEMGSIITTRVVTWTVGPDTGDSTHASDVPAPEAAVDGGSRRNAENIFALPPKTDAASGATQAPAEPAFNELRSDDVIKLLTEVVTRPGERGLEGVGEIAVGLLIVFVGMAVAVLLAFGTYRLGRLFSGVVLPSATGSGLAPTRG